MRWNLFDFAPTSLGLCYHSCFSCEFLLLLLLATASCLVFVPFAASIYDCDRWFRILGFEFWDFGILGLLYIVDSVCLSLMSRSPSPPVLQRQLPLPLFASGTLMEGSFGDRSKENACLSAHQVKPKDASLQENVRPSAHLVTPKDTSPLEDRSPNKKKTRTSEEGAIGRTPSSGAEGGRSDDTPTRMLGMGRRVLDSFAYKTPNDARALPPSRVVPPPTPLKERRLLVGRGSERPKSNVSSFHCSVVLVYSYKNEFLIWHYYQQLTLN